MRIGVCEISNGVDPSGEEWARLKAAVRELSPKVLVVNEMPFGSWFAKDNKFDKDIAHRSVALHEKGLTELGDLGAEWIVSSRPLISRAGRLINEAFTLNNGAYRAIHQKHYFPSGPGFYETDWFDVDELGFDVADAGELRIGALLCTELMFTEWARHYRAQGTNVIVVPRASMGGKAIARWKTAASMAAITSGCYVASSNRSGPTGEGSDFGGTGFIFGPDGVELAETTAENPLAVIEIDLDWVAKAQSDYPNNVSDIHGRAAAELA